MINFTDDIGIPEVLWTDEAGEFTGKNTQSRHMCIKLRTAERGCKNQNYAAENEIGTLKKRWKLRMAKKKANRRLWDFGLIYESEILCRMA